MRGQNSQPAPCAPAQGYTYLAALQVALSQIASDGGDTDDRPVIVCLDLQAALPTINADPVAQTSRLGTEIWRLLRRLADRGSPVHLQ